MTLLNETHDPRQECWLESANQGGDFPLQNLPYGVFRRAGSNEAWRGGVAIGDQIVDLESLATTGLCTGMAGDAMRLAARPSLNAYLASGPEAWSAVRATLFAVLRRGAAHQSKVQTCLLPQSEAEYAVPAQIGDYTDFYTSIHHARNVGKLFRPDNPLLPNYRWVPVGYHGRSSSIVISGQAVRRPWGQSAPVAGGNPGFQPCRKLDYEMELGAYIGPGNSLGEPIGIRDAESHLFGLCLLNDWSARDVQAWEYQPLGPFLAKNFATSVSPWIVSLEALAPFRVPLTREPTDPAPLPYLASPDNAAHGAFDIQLQVWLETSLMRQRATAPKMLSHTSFRHAYWTLAQLVAHHTASGCNLQPGDLLGTGTQSGPNPGEQGSLIEITQGGSQPLELEGETRTFLEDGDRVIFGAFCERPGATRIGFGSLSAVVLPAPALPPA
jgi:fumarylacetoacetase